MVDGFAVGVVVLPAGAEVFAGVGVDDLHLHPLHPPRCVCGAVGSPYWIHLGIGRTLHTGWAVDTGAERPIRAGQTVNPGLGRGLSRAISRADGSN